MNYIIIPIYNEESRLKVNNFEKREDCFYILVNDGSTDHSQAIIENNFLPYFENMHLINIPKNRGKAKAVHAGITYLKRMNIGETDTFGYMDADFSVTVDEYIRVRKTVNNISLFVFGSRIEKGNKVIKKKIRYFIGRSINLGISLASNLPFYDTQCGCKIFNGKLIDKFDEPFKCNWLFDVEILLKLKNINPLEIPIDWKHKGGSKVKFYHLGSIILDLIKIFIMRMKVSK